MRSRITLGFSGRLMGGFWGFKFFIFFRVVQMRMKAATHTVAFNSVPFSVPSRREKVVGRRFRFIHFVCIINYLFLAGYRCGFDYGYRLTIRVLFELVFQMPY
ncbi:hypothetical protein GYMLUDRAFT_878962 [Collybiopsis luxurians FD-317 M1]|uniref:Unplaced genomic scaffold GYMLUscaffold_60, whole genome shotgun sequence n=1 Tax=Collybiopsis luxurians FD-317 M1 TaxID=944289 RepID=A0A0D0BKH7_9AGAR|nr:hypothetical protein GYMLUDRAFT_878962 [Collybiopsis luxurians FD-317 M1]